MLTNELRKAFGIKEIRPDWIKIPLKGLGEVYYDKQLILHKFVLEGSENEIFHRETDYNLQLDKDLNIIGKKGRIQKLSYAVVEKFKPSGKYLFINKHNIELFNHGNNTFLIKNWNFNFKNDNEVILFFKNRLSNQTEFEKNELSQFLSPIKRKKEKFKTGDIFRIKMAEKYFAYGRIICNLKNFRGYSPSKYPELPVDWRGRSLFDKVFGPGILVDFYVTLTDNPNLNELNEKRLTFTLFYTLGFCNDHFSVVDFKDVDPDSFNLPMFLDTYYNDKPITQIFKWGPDVRLFNHDFLLEKYRESSEIDRGEYQVFSNLGLAEYISSFRHNNDGVKTKKYGDLRGPYFQNLRKIISKNIGYDIDKGNYDEYAQKFGFMTKKEIIEFCKLRKPIKK